MTGSLKTQRLMAMALGFVLSLEGALGASFIDLGQIDQGVSEAGFEKESQMIESRAPSSADTIYWQSGRLLGFIPMSFSVRAVTNTDGSIEVKKPWYAFLVMKKRVKIGKEN